MSMSSNDSRNKFKGIIGTLLFKKLFNILGDITGVILSLCENWVSDYSF